MPLCDPTGGLDKRSCGEFLSPRVKEMVSAPDTPRRPVGYSASDPISQRRTGASSHLTAIDETSVTEDLMDKVENLTQRSKLLEKQMNQKAEGKDSKAEDKDSKLMTDYLKAHVKGLEKLTASIESLPDILRTTSNEMIRQNAESHAKLQEFLKNFEKHMKHHTSSSSDQHRENAQQLEHIMDRFHTAFKDAAKSGGPPKLEKEITRVSPELPDEISGPGLQSTPNDQTSQTRRLREAANVIQFDNGEALVKMAEVKKAQDAELEASNRLEKHWWHEWRQFPDNELSRFVHGDIFNGFASFIIVCNTIILGVQTDVSVYRAINSKSSDPGWFIIVNWLFLILFSLELVFRLGAERLSFVLGRHWAWNAFDSFMVLAAYMEVVGSSEASNYTFLRVVKVVRMFRAVRILRVFRYVRDLRLMVVSIAGSFVALFWAFLLLFLLIYCLSIMICQGVTSYFRFEWSDPGDTHHGGLLEKYYGTLPRAMFSLVLAISGGMDWHELLSPLSDMNVWVAFCFIVYTLFVLFGMLNVLTGIFVDRASEMSHLDRDLVVESEKRKVETFSKALKKVFAEMDSKGSGFINWPEFQRYCERDDVRAYFASVEITVDESQELFRMLDNRHSGHVSIDEFIRGCLRLKGAARSLDLLHLQEEISSVKNLLVLVGDQIASMFLLKSDLPQREGTGTSRTAGSETDV